MKASIFEVGARDGLQNEKTEVAYSTKLALIQKLLDCGIMDLEVGAFVNPKRVPQMADTPKLYGDIASKKISLKKARAWGLVPNLKGLENAVKAGATHIAVFTAASESFVKKNINMSIAESLTEFKKVVREAKKLGIVTRGYVSTAFGCPYEGKVAPKQALRVIDSLGDMGVVQISVGDTIGVGTPNQVDDIIAPTFKKWGVEKTAVHFHDTRGTALANALRAWEMGVRIFDSSAGGLGGCPFAPGAKGNLATEDLLYMFHGMGIQTGIDLDKLCKVSLWMASELKRPLTSRYLQAVSSATIPRGPQHP